MDRARRAASGLYRTDPPVSTTQHDVEYAEASFPRPRHHHLARQQRRHHRPQIGAQYEEGFAAGTQAADGMRIDRSYSPTGSQSPISIPKPYSTNTPSH